MSAEVTITLEGTLLSKRQAEWAYWLAHPTKNPLSHRQALSSAEVTLENKLCVYVQDARSSDGLRHAGHSVTQRSCATVVDCSSQEASRVKALLAEVRAHLAKPVKPGGYTMGWIRVPRRRRAPCARYSPLEDRRFSRRGAALFPEGGPGPDAAKRAPPQVFQ